MLSLLTLSALLVPQVQAPSAADVMPADTFLYLEMSVEPFDRLGEHTIPYQLYKKAQIADALAPLQAEMQKQLDTMSMDLGFDLGSLIGSSRFSFGLTWEILANEGGFVPIGVEMSPAIAQNVHLDAILNEAGIGSWWQGGNLLFGVIHTDELEQMDGPNPAAAPVNKKAEGAKYLQALLNRAAEKPGSGMTGLASWKAMSARCRSNDDLFGGWLMMDHFNLDMFSEMIGEEIPSQVVEIFEILELDKFRGLSWTTSVAPPMLEDRIMVYGPGMMQKYFPTRTNEVVNMPGLMNILPHDSYQTMMFAANFPQFGVDLQKCIDLMLELSGEEMPEEAADIMIMVFALFAETGPVFCSNTRAEDYGRSLPGDLWVQASHPEKVTEILAAGLPAGLADSLQEGMMFGPGIPEVMFAVKGNRLTVFESIAQATTQVLGEQPEFRAAAKLFAKYPVAQVYGAEYQSKAMMVEAMNTLRSEGNSLLEALDAGDVPFDFKMLPEMAVVDAVMQSSATVSLVTPEGYYAESHSAFGRLINQLLVQIPTALQLMNTFGMVTSGEFEEEEF